MKLLLVFPLLGVLIGCISQPKTQTNSSLSLESVGQDQEVLLDGEPLQLSIEAFDTNRAIAVSSINPLRKIDGIALTSGSADIWLPRNDLLKIHTLNIGAGSCHILDCPNTDNSLLIDCGSKYRTSGDLEPDETLKHFNQIVTSNYAMFLTHPDSDHVNLIESIVNTRLPESIWFGGLEENYKGSVASEITLTSHSGVTVRGNFPRDYFYNRFPLDDASCGDANIYLLTANQGSTKNSRSLMLMIAYFSKREQLFLRSVNTCT